MSKAMMGAVVEYCGHGVTFVADIFEIDGVNVVRANAPIKLDDLHKKKKSQQKATHHMVDFPRSGFCRPDLGVFVVPGEQVREVKR